MLFQSFVWTKHGSPRTWSTPVDTRFFARGVSVIRGPTVCRLRTCSYEMYLVCTLPTKRPIRIYRLLTPENLMLVWQIMDMLGSHHRRTGSYPILLTLNHHNLIASLAVSRPCRLNKPLWPVKFFSKLNYLIFRYFDPTNNFFDHKNKQFLGWTKRYFG